MRTRGRMCGVFGGPRALRYFVAFLLLGVSAAWASITGSISGVVSDSSGAVIPGVTVVALNTQTGILQSVVSDNKGFYNVPALDIGTLKSMSSEPGSSVSAKRD